MILSYRAFLSLGVVFALGMAGCGKREEPPAPVVSDPRTEPTISTGGTSLVPGDPTLDRAVESAVDDMKRMGESAQETTEVMVEEAQAQVESWIAEVRVLLAEKKYPEAIERLEKLRRAELTPEQQKRVDELKAELENLSGRTIEAGRKALGGLLDGNH